MGLMQRTIGRWAWNFVERELRSSLENPQTPLSFPAEWLLDIFNGGRTDSGIRVSEMTALQTDAVLACVRIICNAVATLPLHIMELQIKDKREAHRKATDHDQYWMLRLRPNIEMTSHTLRMVAMCHALLWGNSYVEIQRNAAAQPIALWPRNPARTRPVRLTKGFVIEGSYFPQGSLVYHTSEVMGDEVSAVDDSENRSGAERLILPEDMIHVPGLTLDGRLGQSTVYLSRQVIGLSLAAEKAAGKYYGNGSTPRGIIELPGTLTGAALETFKRSWQEAYGGENQHKTAVLEKGVKFTPISSDPDKSQLVQTREYQRKVIASIFNVPVHMIGEGSSSKSTVEQTAIEFLQLTIGPWLNAFEQEFKVKLFPLDSSKQATFYAKFDTHKLLYPDAESRSKYYVAGKTGGWLSSNDIRELEDLNPIEDGSGDVYWMPVNMQDAANPLTAPHIGGAQNAFSDPKRPENPQGGQPQNDGPNKGNKATTGKQAKNQRTADLVYRYEKVFYPMFLDATRRIMKRDVIPSDRFTRCFTASLVSMAEALNAELEPSVEERKVRVAAGDLTGGLTAGDFTLDIVRYLEGMRFNLQGTQPSMDETYATREVRRAIETFADLIDRRYNPNHAEQPRHADGSWNDGSKPFYIGRHGTTQDDLEKKWSGWLPTKLAPQGRDEVKASAEKLKGLGIKRIVSGSLPRAIETAQIYAAALSVPITIDPRIDALDLGIFAGMEEGPNQDKLKIYIDHPDMPIPGGQNGGESINKYVHDIIEGVDDLRGQNESSGPILAITHSSAIAVYLETLDGDKYDLEHATGLVTPASVLRLSGNKVKVIAGSLGKGDAA